MDWLEQLNQIKSEGGSCVLVSIVQVRGHAPREAGAKMVVSSSDPSSDPSSNMSGSVGGGNLEQMCIVKARGMLERGGPKTELLTVPLTLKNTGPYGVQCCGGEVTLTLEHFNFSKPQVAIFGAGHVGLALARVLSTLPIEILLVDSRADIFSPPLSSDDTTKATLNYINKPFPEYPEQVVNQLKPGSSAVILTHDHAEDLAILEQCLRRPDLAYIGLIGSSVKWIHFSEQLGEVGFTDLDLGRVTTPIGVPGVRGKTPEVIAISVAAQLLERMELLE